MDFPQARSISKLKLSYSCSDFARVVYDEMSLSTYADCRIVKPYTSRRFAWQTASLALLQFFQLFQLFQLFWLLLVVYTGSNADTCTNVCIDRGMGAPEINASCGEPTPHLHNNRA